MEASVSKSKRWAHPFGLSYRRIVARTLNLTDYFLPERVLDRETILRARIAIFLIGCSALMMSLGLVVNALLGTLIRQQVYGTLIVVAMQIAFLFLIRKTRQVEWVGTAYLLIICLIITMETLLIAKSYLHPGLQVFPLILVFGFFISPDLKKRALLMAAALFGSTISYLGLRDMGFVPAFGMEPDKFVEQLSTMAFLKSLLVILCMRYYVKVKDMSEEDLERELAWEQRQAKLDEIWRMIKSLFPEFAGPLHQLAADIHGARQSQKLLRAEDVDRLEDSVAEMVRISQSIGWVYRAYRNDRIGPTPLPLIREQIETLMQRKLRGSGWTFRMLETEREFAMQGPVPSLLLLLLSLVDFILEHSSAVGELCLEMRVNEKDNEVLCDLRGSGLRAGTIFSAVSARNLRLDIVDDLLKNAGALVGE